MKLGATGTCAVSGPRTAATATTAFPRFRDGAAFGACKTAAACCRGGCTTLRNKHKTLNSHQLVMHIHATEFFQLTFACLRAFKPAVISFSVASASAILIPNTARSATTDSAGFLERAAFGTRHWFSGR